MSFLNDACGVLSILGISKLFFLKGQTESISALQARWSLQQLLSSVTVERCGREQAWLFTWKNTDMAEPAHDFCCC